MHSIDLTELYHHGPEDIVISLLNFIGAFVILTLINVKLALLAFLFITIMGIYGFCTAKKMYAALRKSSDKIGDINAQVEDTLAGIRVIKSFTNEEVERFYEVSDGKILVDGHDIKNLTMDINLILL